MIEPSLSGSAGGFPFGSQNVKFCKQTGTQGIVVLRLDKRQSIYQLAESSVCLQSIKTPL